MEPLDYLRALKRRWPIVLAAALLGGLVAWLLAPAPETIDEQRSYTATHTLFDDPNAPGSTDVGLSTIALLAGTGEIPRRVAEEVDADVEPQVLADQVTISTDTDIGTLTITMNDRDGEYAARVVNTWAQEILLYFEGRQSGLYDERSTRLRERQQELEQQAREIDQELQNVPPESVEAELLSSEREAIARQYGIATEQLSDLDSTEVAGIGIVTLEEAAPVPVVEGGITVPSNRNTRAGLGTLLGLFLGGTVALFSDRVDTRLRDRRQTESAFRHPVLTEIPYVRGVQGQIITVAQPASFAAEAYRILRLSLQMAPRWVRPSADHHPTEVGNATNGHAERRQEEVQVVLVTSGGAAEGKTSTVANIAASYAELGKRVLVLDCDFRNPQQHHLFDVSRTPGVTEYLARGPRRPKLEALAQPTQVPGVRLVANGSFAENPGELLGPDQDIIRQARSLADIVIVDAGPVLAVNDPSALMPQADAVVVVARSGRTTSDSAARTVDLLGRMSAPVVGVALVAVPRSSSGQPYYAQLRSVPGPAQRRWRSTAGASSRAGSE